MADWVRVASTADCRENACLHGVAANGEEIVLVRWNDEFFAMEDRCSHQDYPLSEGEMDDEGRLECVFHGAKFDVRSGKAVQLPAIKPVRTFPVDVRGEDIYVDVS